MEKRYFANLSAGMILLFALSVPGLQAQDEEKPDNRPIRPPFETISLIDNQPTVNLFKGSLQFEIAHRFDDIEWMPFRLTHEPLLEDLVEFAAGGLLTQHDGLRLSQRAQFDFGKLAAALYFKAPSREEMVRIDLFHALGR